MMHSYWNPVKIVIGRGSLGKLPTLLGGRTAVLVTTPGMVRRGVAARVEDLCGARLLHVTAEVVPNPTLASIGRCLDEVEQHDFEAVIGLGGGSVLDTAKAVALLSGHSASEGWINRCLGHPASNPDFIRPKPVIAIPTTSGTGSEVTPWATVWDKQSGEKYSISDEALYPEHALLDAELTDSLPYETTLFAALDALAHSMEAIWNKNANPVSDVLAQKAISILSSVLADGFREKYALQRVRDKLQLSSLLSGLAFSNTKTALAHSISYPLTAKLNIPHGLACSFSLPEVMRINFRQDGDRVAIVVKALGCTSIEDAVANLVELFKAVDVPGYLRPFSADLANVANLDVNFVTEGRAGNNIAFASQSDALDILRSATALFTA